MSYREPFISLADPKRWQHIRQQNMESARRCRETLTDPASHWRYAPDDTRVKEAVAVWVERARRAHAIALGRQPVIANLISITNEGITKGSLYAH